MDVHKRGREGEDNEGGSKRACRGPREGHDGNNGDLHATSEESAPEVFGEVHHGPRQEGAMPEDETRYIREDELDADPMIQFGRYFAERARLAPAGPPIMTVATCSANGRPSARTVVLNGFDEEGFLFFTNRDSLKGQNIAENPQAALVLFWPEMMLQVRAEGRVELGTEHDNAHCVSKIPRNMNILALAYKQSTIIPDRKSYVDRVRKIWQQFPSEVPFPPGWTAYKIIPDRIEFWNGTSTSLVTDRVEYVKQRVGDVDQWRIFRLAAP